MQLSLVDWLEVAICVENTAFGVWFVHRYRSDRVGNAEQRDWAISFFALAGVLGLVLVSPLVVSSSGLVEGLVAGSTLVLMGIALFNIMLIYGRRIQRKRTTVHGGHDT
jgi:hypothetical protein